MNSKRHGAASRIQENPGHWPENCDFADYEEIVLRDVFITEMWNKEAQRQLLRETHDPRTALHTAIKMKMGQQIN